MRERQALARCEEAAQQELEEARKADEVGYLARVTVQATLPHSKPAGDVYIRRNAHHMTLRITALSSAGLPYGSLPRLLLAWVTTEAVRTRSPELHLGHTLQEFLDHLGLGRGGGPRGDITRLRNQMRRLFSCAISVEYTAPGRDAWEGIQIASRRNLWWDPANPDQLALWGSTVVLTDEFYREAIKRPVPVNMTVLRQLRGSPLALDIYAWLTWRMSFLRHQTSIPWEYLTAQFGADYARTRDFRRRFAIALGAVLEGYPEADVDPERRALVLSPSPPSVPRAR